MSDDALRACEEAEKQQQAAIQARKIRIHVDHARQSPDDSGPRWPFELLQNAVDPGPRGGRTSVSVELRCDPDKVVFKHDGKPFEPRELMALLSGGSSKDYDSEKTTGRFGTGFLVTHVLAEQVRMRGLLSQEDRPIEHFKLALDRAGDEDAILRDIAASKRGISDAQPVQDMDSVPTAHFEYPYGETGIESAVEDGLVELRRALPFLYGTRPTLGRVELRVPDGAIEAWVPTEPAAGLAVEGGSVEFRSIIVDGSERRELSVHRFTADGGSASAIVLVEKTAEGQTVCRPDPSAPRIFRDYPLRSSGFLPVWVVLDGKFEVDPERTVLSMSDIDKALLQEALAAGVIAARYATERGWNGAHWLADTRSLAGGFRRDNAAETNWWKEQLRNFAERLAVLPMVKCEKQMRPAIATDSDVGPATFVVPRLRGSANDETTLERLLPLVAAVTDLNPPIAEVAADWTRIAEGWSSLDVEVTLTCVNDVAEHVRATTVDDLKVEDHAMDWLASFIDIVGECWRTSEGRVQLSVLEGLMPNQIDRLCSPGDLQRDCGISERIKDICADLGLDVRGDLLSGCLQEAAERLGLQDLETVLERSVAKEAHEDGVIEAAIQRMDDLLPEDEKCEQLATRPRRACVQSLDHLWRTKQADALPLAQQVPLLASDRSGARWGRRRQFMAPVCAWPASAQPFAAAYPPDRVLDGMYAGSDTDGIPNVCASLAEWGIAFTDPVTHGRFDLTDHRLRVLAPEVDTEDSRFPQAEMSQIALLSPELILRAESDIARAADLLGLVLCHVAGNDAGWKQVRNVEGRTRDGDETNLQVVSAVWLADLKVRPWVPVAVEGEDGKKEMQKMNASAATLEHLLESSWLEDNDDGIRLLSEWFDFDQLNLRLLGMANDPASQQELRDSLAALVDAVGADPEAYLGLAQDVQDRERLRRDVDQCRRLGLAVQESIGNALEEHNLDVTLVDRGFDFEVDAFEDTSTKLDYGPYLVEVKATRTGQARLTPLQAATATEERARYVLCVVDLRGVRPGDLDGDGLDAQLIESLAKIVPDVGPQVAQAYGSVRSAQQAVVPIRNEGALRYEVVPGLWETGVSISDWVQLIGVTHT
ncbi:MAG: ATP-binding protein [Gammaproteobacteria bacterium]|nr:ATP-binding protein [Gammaproteobacteria bacterium]